MNSAAVTQLCNCTDTAVPWASLTAGTLNTAAERNTRDLCFIERVLTNETFSVDKKNRLDVTFCILYFSSNSCSTCFGQPCAHHQELTTA